MKTLLIILIICSSCSPMVTINGQQVKKTPENTKVGDKERFWMMISFLLSFGLWEHFYNPKKI